MIPFALFLDSETTINGGEVHGPHPMHPDNFIVVGGIKVMGDLLSETQVHPASHFSGIASAAVMEGMNRGGTVTLVGHNLAFDLKYMIRDRPEFADFLSRNDTVSIWDTMVAEYVLNGQDSQLPLTLEATCQRYGIPFKKSPEMKALFESGKGADHADPEILKEYVSGDVDVLPILFAKQMERAREQGQTALIMMRMEARKALIMAEYHGMAFDASVISAAMPAMQKELESLKARLEYRIPDAGGITLDLTSPKQLAIYLYGGEKVVTEKVPDGLYKNGKIRWKNRDVRIKIEPQFFGVKDASTSEETLNGLIASAPTTDVIEKIEAVLQFRLLNKELSTYCVSLLQAVIHNKIHANINCTVTSTGRLSSSKPNLQNIKNGKLKAAFVSRYGREGRLIEIDFAQLEIIALAVLSRDEQLLTDVMNGIDIHTALYEDMYHRTPDKHERKAFKPRTFALVYGASASGIARNAKISRAEAHKFISTFYKRYKGVQFWHQNLKAEYAGKSIAVPGKFPEAKFQHRSPTGLLLTYYTDKGSFSPTQMVNYPVQSFAADLVQVMVSVLFRWLSRNFPTALLVNVVHDSIVIDCQAHEADLVAGGAVAILRDTPFHVRESLGFDMDPIDKMEVGVTMGLNWADMEEVKI